MTIGVRARWQKSRLQRGQDWLDSMLDEGDFDQLEGLAEGEIIHPRLCGKDMFKKSYDFGHMYALFTWAASQPGFNHPLIQQTAAKLPLCRRHRSIIGKAISRQIHPVSRGRR